MEDTLNYKMELVSDLSDALKNMKQFKMEVEKNLIPLEKLKSFYAWYYIGEYDLFCPSKYIKYKNMTYDMYNYFDVVRKQISKKVQQNIFMVK